MGNNPEQNTVDWHVGPELVNIERFLSSDG